jgi:hypothetical protein
MEAQREPVLGAYPRSVGRVLMLVNNCTSYLNVYLKITRVQVILKY